MTFEDARSAREALTARNVSFGNDLLYINAPVETMWGRYIRPDADELSRTPKHPRRVNNNPASDQFQPSISFPQPSHTAQGIRLQSLVPSPASKPSMRHRISDSLDTNHSFPINEPRYHIPGASSNIRQYHQLEREVTFETNPSMSSVPDITPNNSHVMEMIERNPESMTAMSLYNTGDLNNDSSALESEAGRLRNERDAASFHASRLTEDLALADREIHRLQMNLSDLGAENSTLKWTVHSLEKELQLAQARVIDAQRQASTNYPPHDSYIHEDHAAGLAEVQGQYSREHRHLKRLEEERKTLLDENQELQKIIEEFKDAEVDLNRKLKSYRTDHDALRKRLVAATEFAGDQDIQEMESKKTKIAHLIRGKEEAECALEQFKRAANIGPELVNAFSEIEAIVGQGRNLEPRKRTSKGSSPSGSSGQFTHGSDDPSVRTPKRQRHQ